MTSTSRVTLEEFSRRDKDRSTALSPPMAALRSNRIILRSSFHKLAHRRHGETFGETLGTVEFTNMRRIREAQLLLSNALNNSFRGKYL